MTATLFGPVQSSHHSAFVARGFQQLAYNARLRRATPSGLRLAHRPCCIAALTSYRDARESPLWVMNGPEPAVTPRLVYIRQLPWF